MRYLVLVAFVLITACGSSPVAPTPTAALEQFPESRVIFDCDNGVCRFIGIAINRGTGCADNVRGTLTVRTLDGAVFTATPWSLPANRVIPAGDSFSYSAPIPQSTFPEQRTTEASFQWRDVGC